MSKTRILPYRLQTGCHLLYVVLFYFFNAQERPIWVPIAMMGSAIMFEVAVKTLLDKQRTYLFSLASVGVANSIFLNMVGFGAFYWPLFLALFVALLVKYLLRCDGRPIFNPSVVGVIFVAALLPYYGSAAMLAWRGEWSIIALVFFLGSITTILSGTFRLSISYVCSFVFWGMAGILFLRVFECGDLCESSRSFPTLLWPLAIFNFGNILFAFHGIGDPGTAPETRAGQIVFGLALGTLDFWGRMLNLQNSNFVFYVILLLAFAYWRNYRSKFPGEKLLTLLKN